MAEDYDYSKNISEYSKNIDARDKQAVENALEKYSYEIGNPKLPLKADDVFKVVDANCPYNELNIKLQRQDDREFSCTVKAVSIYEKKEWSLENKRYEEIVTPYSGKWIVSVEGKSYYKDENTGIAVTMMELSDDGTTLKPVKEEDILTLARYVEEEKQNWRSSYNFSYMESMYKQACHKAFNLDDKGNLKKKSETLLEKGLTFLKG